MRSGQCVPGEGGQLSSLGRCVPCRLVLMIHHHLENTQKKEEKRTGCLNPAHGCIGSCFREAGMSEDEDAREQRENEPKLPTAWDACGANAQGTTGHRRADGQGGSQKLGGLGQSHVRDLSISRWGCSSAGGISGPRCWGCWAASGDSGSQQRSRGPNPRRGEGVEA